MQKFGKCYSADNGSKEGGVITRELGYRPVVCALFPIFTRLAPRRGESLEGEDPKYLDREPVAFVHEQAGIDMEVEGVDGEGNRDEASSMMSDLSGWSFSSGKFRHEDGMSLKPHEAVDTKGYVIDVTLPGRPSVARSLFEMKGAGPWLDVVRQILYYGSMAAIQNVVRGRFKKVHLVVLGIGWAGCAEVDPVGHLDIGPQNVLSPASVAAFKKQAECKYTLLNKCGKTDEANALKVKYMDVETTILLKRFQNRLKASMGDAATRLNSSTTTDMYAPLFNKADRILVGKATYRKETLPMMQYPVESDAVLLADSTVVSGIARIIFGDRALKWTLPALLAHAARRQDEAELEAKQIMSRRLI